MTILPYLTSRTWISSVILFYLTSKYIILTVWYAAMQAVSSSNWIETQEWPSQTKLMQYMGNSRSSGWTRLDKTSLVCSRQSIHLIQPPYIYPCPLITGRKDTQTRTCVGPACLSARDFNRQTSCSTASSAQISTYECRDSACLRLRPLSLCM